MIKLDSIELEKTMGDANSVARTLVKKAVEEEMKLRPFSDEELNELSEAKKNVEIEYFLNLLAKNNVTVNEVEILVAYKENLSAFGDKDVTEIYPQLHQLVFNKKLESEKAVIVNGFVSKYGLNSILKEYVPELKNLGDGEKNTSAEEPVTSITSEPESVEEFVVQEIPQNSIGEEDTKIEMHGVTASEEVTSRENIQVEPFVVDAFITEDLAIKEEPVIVESPVYVETPAVEDIIPESFILNVDEISKEDDSLVTEEVAIKTDILFSAPFDSTEETPFQDNFVEETPNLFEAPQVAGEFEKITEIEGKSEHLEEVDSSNEPPPFGNFNFKFD